MRSSMHMVGILGLVTLLAGCAVDPSEGKEADKEIAGDEATVGQVDQPLKWTRPKCMDDTWVCGKCICNACNVEDCRNAVVSSTVTATAN